jgi:hypothetical protein
LAVGLRRSRRIAFRVIKSARESQLQSSVGKTRQIQNDIPDKDVSQKDKRMAQNHYVTKTKRRKKSGKRMDPSKATMAVLRRLAAAEAEKSGK